MANEWDSLIALQQVDIHIAQLKTEQKEFPEAIAELEKTIGAEQNVVDSLNKRLANQLIEKKSIEEKITDATSQLEKSQTRLNEIKTNREYDAVHQQIENFKSSVTTGEARLATIATETEQLQAALEKAVADLDTLKQTNTPRLAELKDKMGTLDSSIAVLTEQRTEAAALVSKPLLRSYDYISKRRKNGQVISFVDASNHICSICHKILEYQLISEVRKMNKMVTCQNCGSIFVWKQDESIQE
jgi:predicted  nucleic acid-binding Zn-ribbon protein